MPKDNATLVYANKWLGTKARQDEQAFNEVYDAVDHELHGWDVARKIPADRVRYSDIIVVECYVRRFRNKELNVGSGWNAWKIAFDLLRIALLVEGQPPLDEPPPESAAVI